ncbi:putative bifunctional diguanylate cyclase/phosphodiesterase [Halanaerobacter jeridensis]|uniref:Diguanylate cyclase (GGDEF)-like protein n=1 Tax=Halanaerobacter jeridensis TaxID=706427 RepID=A0A938XQH2_9FIRM|nr:EAL domain-containing protein [Halanaerobacter jeridensis]MBM7555438.1 diguanylate cyclase (GGDEF)-like protein [Halanaerobacter jeridensis]
MNNKLKNRLINNELERGILIVDGTGNILGVNKYAAKSLQTEPSEILNYNLDYFIKGQMEVDLKDLNHQNIINLELTTAKNNKIKVNSCINSFYYKEQEVYEFNFITSNNANFKEKLNLLAQFPEKNPNPVLKISNSGELLYSNPVGNNIVQELQKKVTPAGTPAWPEFVEKFIEQQQTEKVTIKHKTFLFQSVPLRHDDAVHLYGRDVSEFQATSEDIENLLNYDFLTGLPTRSLFPEQLEKSLDSAQENNELLGVLFIDLDNFKKVNDSLGHAMGDRLLANVAQKLRDFLGEDNFLARLSGDEFGAIINHCQDIQELSELLENLINHFSEPFKITSADGHESEIFMTLSVGAAVYPNDSENLEQLIKDSETAKNKVKENGKNHYRFYSDEMNEEMLQDLELEAKLRHAIDNNEFVLHYQPQIDLNNDRVFGVEALIRWEDEELGLVSPGKFIPLAERTGLIIPIGDWVLEQACREAKEFHEAGFPNLKMGINLSARQFADNNLVEKISNILSETELNPAKLELEITESIIMKDVKESVKKLIKLKKLGVKFSIDDFGTGYSSLSYLKEFPIGTLKIDRSFVDQLPSDENDTAIVKAIIDLAHNLNLNVIAEGVENPEHLQFLEQNDCDRIQGYYFGKPMSKKEIVKFLTNEPWKVVDV